MVYFDRVILLLALMLLSFSTQAEVVTTLQLHNRPAVEVIPIIQPMLEHGDKISGHGFKIFLRSSKETHALVQDMIEVIDAASKMLQISVRQGGTREHSSKSIGGNISIGTDEASANISGSSTEQHLLDNPVHRLRVTEGNEGFIETGKKIALFSGGAEFKKATTGFYVRPRVYGDNVTLQVSSFKNSNSNTSGGSINTQQANTIISGRLGEWLLIGGASEQVKRSQSGTSGYSSVQSSSNESIWIKAEVIR